jgi:hypothetical protein
MRAPVLALMLAVVSSTAMAQSVQDQINAVDAVQERRRQAEDAALAAQQAAQAGQLEETRREHQRQEGVTRNRMEAVAVKERVRQASADADKQRDQGYEDKLRALEIEERTLRLQADRGVVARENEYIDRDLQQRAAETDITKSRADVVRSEADANRSISTGIKTYLDHAATPQRGRYKPETYETAAEPMH